MSADAILRWTGAELIAADRSADDSPITVADSWLVTDGCVLALDLHRERFLATAPDATDHDARAFFDAALAALPRQGEWFPRVELSGPPGARELLLRVRRAPSLTASVTLTTHHGEDPRHDPSVKGPSLHTLEALRSQAHHDGADDIVVLDPLGHIVEGGANAIAWWRGDILCMPAEELARVDSVTARALAALAVATGTALSWETTAPEELDGHEIWALNALHGPRIVTRWIDGPSTAEEPGRLRTWRARLHALRRPLPTPAEALA